MARRAAKEKATGKKIGGKPPKAPEAGPKSSDQINLTDEESRIMPVSGGGFEQAYNAQASADVATLLVVATHVTQAANDKEANRADAGAREGAVRGLGHAELPARRHRVLQREKHHCLRGRSIHTAHCRRARPAPSHWRERHSEPALLPPNASAVQSMAHRLKTKAGRAQYALCKQTIEPVFGIIKSVMGFRQFSLRGLANVNGEWRLVCLAWNLKPMAV